MCPRKVATTLAHRRLTCSRTWDSPIASVWSPFHWVLGYKHDSLLVRSAILLQTHHVIHIVIFMACRSDAGQVMTKT